MAATAWTAAWAATAALLSLGTGVASLALAVTRAGDRPARLAHAAMGAGMAGMFSPWGDPLPAWLGAGAFAVLGAWFGAAVLRGGRAALHLTISCAAMVLMYLTHHGAHRGAAVGAGGGGHAGHHAGGGADLVVLPLALVLAAYFVWHAWTCLGRGRATPSDPATPAVDAPVDAAPPGTTAVRPRRAVEPLAHAVMSVLMAATLLGVV